MKLLTYTPPELRSPVAWQDHLEDSLDTAPVLCTTAVHGHAMRPWHGLLRISIEVIETTGDFHGQASMVRCDWSEGDWEDAARAALEDCIRKENERILREVDALDEESEAEEAA